MFMKTSANVFTATKLFGTGTFDIAQAQEVLDHVKNKKFTDFFRLLHRFGGQGGNCRQTHLWCFPHDDCLCVQSV